ncbi:NAD(P)-binding protein [Corynespora cassiicola Philippines]|uniref:NAD(P)-binding protein n=1 Tax=Corynespora cassiicola Philippines TaxID=1448308 RepID=A0A2T2NFF5_CORCC|nr:NAD(P)-binding protein [Corynespora cassiicola Philippines]
MAKIFLTGASGYLGGDVLYRIASAEAGKHSISALVRSAGKAERISTFYPHIRIVQGDIDDSLLIESEARNADVVLHLATTSHLESVRAIQRGLTDSSRKSTGHWIQISGATLLAQQEIADGRLGFQSDKVYDDVDDIDKIISIIKKFPNRAVDNLVISQDASKIKTALIVGPHFYGIGRGPVNTRSIQAPEIARIALKLQKGFRLGEGNNRWSYLHVHDLSDLVAKLVDAAVERQATGIWNQEGIYLPENGNMKFGELNAQIAVEAKSQGLIPDGSVDTIINAKEADELSGHASVLWGTNAISRSSRAQANLGWQPLRPSLGDEIRGIVQREGRSKL